MSTAGASALPFRVLSQNNMTGDNVLFYDWQLLGVKTSHAHKTRFWYLLDDQPRVPPPPGQKGSLHQ